MNSHIPGELFPLSLSQQNILSLERVYSGTSVNNISTTIRIEGRVDFPILQKSINLVLESDPSLRTVLTEADGVIMQYHAPYVREEHPVYDFSNTSTEGIENWEIAVTRELIPLENGPLYRFVLFRDSETGGGVLVKLHHIIADGWSQINICNKIGKTYLELLAGKTPTLEPAPDYRVYVEKEQEYLNSKAYLRDEAYWREVVENAGEPSVIKSVGGAAVSPVGRRLSFDLPQILNHAVYSYCEEKRIAPFAVFYMALAIYFKRIGGAERFTVGVPIFNRTSFEFKQSTGMFVTTLPFYNEIKDEWSLDEFNDELMDRWYDMLRHQWYPFSRIMELSGNNGRLFNIALSYQASKIYESRDASVTLSGRWHYCGYQAEQLTIHVTSLKSIEEYSIDYDYLAQYFTEEDILNLHKNLCHILGEALLDPKKPIHGLNVLSMEEKERLIYTFNDTDKYLEERSAFEALVEKSARYLNRVAIIHNGERMTYGTLLYKGSRYASAVSEKMGSEGELAAIMLPREFELPAAMVGVLGAGCAYLLISESLPTERIRTILKGSGAGLLITDEKGKARLSDIDIPVLTTAEADGYFAAPNIKNRNTSTPVGDRLAYVVYTSGSTGEPKGVEISQRNLLNFAAEMESVYGQGAVLSLCNVGFDAFMIESIVALLNGKTVVFPEDDDLNRPERLSELMNGYAVGFFSMTPSRLEGYLRSSAFRRVMWRMESIVCGGEQFPPELLKKLKTYTNARIYNQYGPSETTVAVSMKELSHAERITAGKPLGNCRLYVLDKWMNPLPIGGNGRLYVGGKCVGLGYRNRPDLTDAAFGKNPFKTNEKIYDTGDLAYWTQDGEIIITGRSDSQIKLRGLRVEPGEIASAVSTFPGVVSAHARVCEINGQTLIGVYYCADRAVNEAELLAHTATYLPEYMIPAFLMRVSAMPTDANGKVDEALLPMPELSSDSSLPMSETADLILSVFRRVLGSDRINGGDDYFLHGGNSLNAMESIMEIEQSLGKKLRIADLYACRSAVRLAALVNGESKSSAVAREEKRSLERSPVLDEYPLTPIQEGMYVSSALDKDGLAYNMPGAFLLEEKPDIDRLEEAFRALIKDDPVFRTVFAPGKDRIAAHVLSHADFAIEHITAEGFDEAAAKFLRTFDLSRAPLLRAAVWQSAEGEVYLFVDSHHIIGDGMSTPVILNRINGYYRGSSSTVLWNYYDYIHTSEKLGAEERRRAGDYWKDHLADTPETLILPTDFTRPHRFDYKGRELEVLIPEDEDASLLEFCKKQGISPFTLYLSAFGILLSAVSGREDFMIGTPVSGRELPGTESICGPFINTLPLRLKPRRDVTAGEWLRCAAKEVAELLDHRSYSAEEIISALDLPRGEGNALYRVMLTESPVDEDSFRLGEGRMIYHPISTGNVKMDMILEIAKKKGTHALRFSYATSLFTEETVAFYGRCMRQIVKELMSDETKTIGELDLLSYDDLEALIDGPNYAATTFMNKPVHKILESRAAAKGSDTAIIFHGSKITYGELERRANAIAAFISEKGLPAGSAVGLCLKRTPDMIAAMYGVLKAGCAYMFMLDSFPEARLSYMLKISEAKLFFYDSETEKALPKGFLDSFPTEGYLLPEGEASAFASPAVSDDSIANILFTSGSTGQPKGVMLRHRSVSNLCSQMKTLLDPIKGTVLCSTNSVFDCFIVETVIALALGRTVVLADEEEMMLPWRLAELVDTYKTGIFEMTPSRLGMCLGNEAFCRAAHNINIVLLGGEAVSEKLLNKFYDHSDGILMNMYGPTEATVFTTMEHLKRGEHITIGKPLMNTRTYVLDENMRPVIPTACGEMYIAGECLSKGYVSRPELTDASYFEDVYFPGQKMYKSGDIVRLRVDGRYDYIGRKDNQVKLNGQRVELGEITGAIEGVSGVVSAATVPIRKEDGTMELCSFYVANGDVTDAGVLSAIRHQLPVYMIPSRLRKLDSMPMTATNKIDMQSLRALADKEPEEAISEAVEETASEAVDTVPAAKAIAADTAYVLSVWNRVLTVPVTDTETSFFKKGGTSMAALSVLSHYYNDGFEMSLSDFYENQTASAQAALLSGAENACSASVEETAEPEKAAHTSTLITGATGFFGAHLTNELVKRGKSDLICLIRGGSEERLYQCFTEYFGKDEADIMMSRVTVIGGDITDKQLGLTEEAYGALAEKVSRVYHSAADVRHYAADEEAYLKVNVGGTENMLAFAKKAGAEFLHVSTCSVSGSSLKDDRVTVDFTENDYDIGQVWEDNIYVKSKFIAEGLVLEAEKEGLRTKIFRLGRLCGRMSDGKFQRDPETNAFYLLIKGFCRIGAIPADAAAVRVDVMPIDVAAREVVALSETEGKIYHIMNATPPTFGEVIAAAAKDVNTVSNGDFDPILREKAGSLDGALWAMVMNNLFETRSGSQSINVTNVITADKLAAIGHPQRIEGLATVLKEFGKGE